MSTFVNDDYCFVCGKKNPIGLKVNVKREEGKAIISISVPKEFQGYKNIVHGGILSTLLDEAMIYSVSGAAMSAVTAKLEVKFMKPVECGREIIVEGKVEKLMKKWALTSGTIRYKDDDEVLCKGEALIRIWEVKKNG